MTDQRMWVRTLDGDVIAVDQVVRYATEEGTATGHVLTVHTASDWRHYVGPFVSGRQALDFARRHFGPVIDPADLADVADVAKYDPPGAVDAAEALDPAPCPPLAVGDTFTAADPRADDLPVGTVVEVIVRVES